MVASTYGNVDSFLKALEEASLHDDDGPSTSKEDNEESIIVPPFDIIMGED